VLELIDKVKAVALKERGIRLETEVQIVGEMIGLHEHNN
jgi:UDP-N-acetylenolpyruvoylglucosamine reductase